MLKIAISGNIASGKSQVEMILAAKYPVYDTDKIAHECLDELTDFFGYDVFTDGKIDRKKLGALVFSDYKLREELEKIIHPQIREKLEEIFKAHRRDKYVFVSVPLLFEAGFTDLFDKIIFVTAKRSLRLKRLMQRNNLTLEEAEARMRAQADEGFKMEYSDFVITNNTTTEILREQVNKILKELKS